jgi:membrane protein YdbS with pleckstrin-like domain
MMRYQQGTWDGMMNQWTSFAAPFVLVLVIVALLLSIVALWKYISHKN